ncbi:MAG: hypothetical protein H6823_06685 [Planctomycetaceae bacterium]|nr:hypothetical protein [Planctomycetales bacterium]MCB9937908.1 hypothetical protein [Planctomycetaceae bacterium]
MSTPKTMLWLCLALAGVVMLTGCKGCNNDPLVERDKKLEDEEKKKKKPEEDFEFQLPHTVPSDDTLAAPLVKPGHWVTVAHDLKANNRNVQAELHTTATDRNEKPIFVDDTPFMLSSSRPAPLPKGQEKRFETPYFIPRAAADESGKNVGLHRELRAAPSGTLLKKDWQPALNMEGYQYFFMVLAADPDRYGYLKRLPSVSSPTADDYNTDAYLYYRVLLPKIERIAPLPTNPLTWTSLAYILWDDADPNTLTPDQCQAMLDWLNWGGQLIISGPNTLEKLNGTFLDEFLPATVSKTVEIDQAAIEELNAHWALPNKKSGGLRTLDVLPGKPLIGVQLEKRPLAEPLANTGGLVFERQVGGGRIVVTAFSLSDRTIVNWTSFDSFFNATLLRRPRRSFRFDSLLADARWTDYHQSLVTDARLVTTLRYFTRDIGHYASLVRPRGYVEPGEEVDESTNAQRVAFQQDEKPRPSAKDLDPVDDDTHFLGYPFRPKSGMAAWNDQSGASDAAREALKVAAGISIPKGDFVLKVLAVYLIVLAPINWGFFRLMGRVEWAWVAAPILAIIGAVAVVRLAQLDIGFARSVTEIGVVEAQGDYSRAHVTRYTALYTSLSSSYDLVFDDASSLAQPFSSNPDFVLGPHDPTYTVSLRRDKELRLSGFQVASNSTQTVHCEQMADLGGTFAFTGDEAVGFRLRNGTPISMKHVGVLRRTMSGEIQTCWIDELPAGMDVSVPFEAAAGNLARLKQWDDAPATFSFDRQADQLLREYDKDEDKKLSLAEVASVQEVASVFRSFDQRVNGRREGDGNWDRGELLSWCRSSRFGELALGQLVDLASVGLRLRPGDVRLVGWSDDNLPGMAIRPTSSQETRRNLFLVHLKRGPLSEPRPDVNTVADFAQDKPKAEIEGTEEPSRDEAESE